MKLTSEAFFQKIKSDILLALFLAIFVVKGIFYAAYAMPLNLHSSPDDLGHISYVVYLATQHASPVLHKTRLERTMLENYNDKLNGTTEGKIYNINTKEYEESENQTAYNWIAQHPPLYYLYLLPFYFVTALFTSNLSMIILALRLATIPVGAVTIYFLYRSMKLLNLGDLAINCVMVCAVFSSAIQFFLVAIDNDAMVICLSTAAFYFFAKWIKTAEVRALYIFAALCGCITITKYTGAVVLPVYALIYLWDMVSIKKRSLKEIFRYSVICILIFAVITAPVIVQNYSRYAVLFPVDENLAKRYDYSLIYFARHSGYYNEIVSHIINLTGWVTLRSTEIERWLVALIALCACFFKSRSNVWLWLTPFVIAITFTQITDMNTTTALIVSTVLCLLALALFDHEREMTVDREICVLSVSMLLFYVVIFFARHYTIYLHRGRTGAMHGRYYYPLIAPFFFLMFRKLDENRDKLIGFLPLALFLVNVGMEIELVLRGIQHW